MNTLLPTPSTGDTIFENKNAKVLTVIYFLFSCWWVWLQVNGYKGDTPTEFPHVYGIVALLGGLLGLSVVRYWGGFQSVMGKALSLFSLGLLFQFFGQMAYSFYYYVFQLEVPYPSIGDIGFFGSIPFYIFGVIFLGKAIGVPISLKLFIKKPIAIIFPLVMLVLAYVLFLYDLPLDMTKPLASILDIGYPLLQTIYISLAFVIYLLSRKSLGGLMRPVVLFLLVALLFQFLSDFIFLFQARRETWYPGGINDFLYLTSYYLMGIGLLRLKTVHDYLQRL